MQTRIPAIALAVAAGAAHAEQPPQPQPAAPSLIAQGKANNRAVVSVVASPIVMQTSAQVMPDGSVRFNCEQKANPHPIHIDVQRRNAEQEP